MSLLANCFHQIIEAAIIDRAEHNFILFFWCFHLVENHVFMIFWVIKITIIVYLFIYCSILWENNCFF